jgi:hypothetical protein
VSMHGVAPYPYIYTVSDSDKRSTR